MRRRVRGRTAAAGARCAGARDPRSYTPKHLAERILQSRSALEGERKQVTVLFADVKGSMDLAAQLDPEECHRILERKLLVCMTDQRARIGDVDVLPLREFLAELPC